MRKNLISVFMAASVLLSFVFSGCGGSVNQESMPAAPGTLQGVAATGMPINGSITLTDTSATPKVKTTMTGENGAWLMNVLLARNTSADTTQATRKAIQGVLLAACLG